MRLRDLLKFDFYFADSAAFREHVAEEMAWHDDWEAHVAAGGDEIDATAAGQAAADVAGRCCGRSSRPTRSSPTCCATRRPTSARRS